MNDLVNSPSASIDEVIAEIDAMFAARGGDQYGEHVTQLQHAVQTAAAAVAAGCDDEQVVAALLHDVGHLVHHDPGGAYESSVDDLHEDLGDRWLRSRGFPPVVLDPVRLHVASKRYLCTVDPAYLGVLSDASRKTLEMQGGLMSDEERAAFEAEPFRERAVQLRRFDDVGKDPGADGDTVASYHDRIRAVLERAGR